MSNLVQIAFVAVGIVLLVVIVIGVGAGVVLATAAAFGGGYGNRAEGEADYGGDRAAALAASKGALRAIGARDIRIDATTGAIHAHRAATRWSGGEDLAVRISPDQPGRQRIAIESRSAGRGTTIDWRQNRRNVAAFLAALASGERRAASGDPV